MHVLLFVLSIAAEVYKEALQEGYLIAGAKQNEDFTVTLDVSDNADAIADFKNSKYVFSSAYTLFPKIKELLKKGEKVAVIGLPCQVAALRKIFRDPETYTYTFTFTLYNSDNQRFYAQRTKDGDTYQFGYHRTVTYRENCYHCHFARDKRISDVTLSDYKGLGKKAPCSFNAIKVSSVLINTPKGETFIKKLIGGHHIFAEERPVREPIEGDLQLRQPSQKKSARFDFERLIVQNHGDFEKTMIEVIKLHERRETRMKILNFPRRVLSKIKRTLLRK